MGLLSRRGCAWPLLLILVFLAGWDMPKDPKGTSDQVTGGTMRVGVIDAPPWASLENGQAKGVESDLVRQFAVSLNARIVWVGGGESRLMQSLTNYQLDLVIGGIEDSTEWRKTIGLSPPYYKAKTVVAAPPCMSAGDNPEGRRVVTAEGDPVRQRVLSLSGMPIPSSDGRSDLVAAEAWQLSKLGLAPTGITLRTASHVIATPPGENGWLLRLDRFLNRHKDALIGLLRAQPNS